MNTKYNHKEVEQGKNQKWIDKKYFSTHDKNKKPFSIILPPPNVTGKLHLGHAWDGFIQDTIIRYKKLKGFDVMWVPGMDHAGIATQAKVEAKLREEQGQTRQELGREKFLDKVWEWKEEYASNIRNQWSTLGLGLDYPNERFTMDEGLSKMVTNVFIDLYNRKLIYRGVRAVNWDPQLQTVLSNIEVINKDTSSKMYYINYPLVDGGEVKVATTRPETMFSDVAIAINPNDKKMSNLIGKIALSPLTNRKLPIIADDYIKIGKGTGAMKVSAHAEADIKIIQDNNLDLFECIDKSGNMNELAGDLKGLNRFDARKEVANKLANHIYKVEDIVNAVGYSERSGEVVETLVQPQWFVDMKPMAKKIIDDLNKDGVKFYPQRFEDTLRTWMEDVQDWCISRQLWWGHRIPAWYKGQEVKVQVECPGEGWKQDEDVLDTWFSSGLAPFSFLGLPDNKEYARFYPTSLLVTGYDIIFFWVARMYFQSLDIMKKLPFKDVLIHGLIRAEDGRKMSKSLGNGIDPMDVIDKYGSDALRWFVMTNSTPGQDIRFSSQKIEAAWNLCNKLWNISRYILEIMPDEAREETHADIWIQNKLSKLESFISKRMDSYDFTIIGKELNGFIMDDFSSWYIEFSKDTPNKEVAKEVLRKILIILHPLLPNITDHIFKMIDGKELLENTWTEITTKGNADYIDRVIEIVQSLRQFRVEKNMSNKTEIIYSSSVKLSRDEKNMIKRLANATYKDNKGITIKLPSFNLYIELSEEQKAEDRERILKRISFLEKEIKRAKGMLSNPRFVEKAPADKVADEKQKLSQFEEEINFLKDEVNNG